MRATATAIPGAWILDLEPRADERGFFARTYCAEEFRALNLNPRLVQCSISFNLRKGTLRGMHWQAAPHEEAKLVRCTRGAIFDALVDLRPDSPSFRKSITVELTAANRTSLYVPEGVAHGFVTLEDNTEILYHMSDYFAPECARGVRWDDPSFAIPWPDGEKFIHERDRAYPDFSA